jgi:Zn-dependent protease
MSDLSTFPLAIIAILVAITVHEWAHAFAAKRLGDGTAEMSGRLTLNPLAHIDPVGAILFLLVGFGWAKPVPVDARNFRHPVRDSALVALAGPLSNLVLGFVAIALLFSLPPEFVPGNSGTFETLLRMSGDLLEMSVRFNFALMAFNLLPIAPLDGSNILRLFIPWRFRDRYEEAMQYGPWILLGLILVESFTGIPLISAWVNGFLWLLGNALSRL